MEKSFASKLPVLWLTWGGRFEQIPIPSPFCDTPTGRKEWLVALETMATHIVVRRAVARKLQSTFPSGQPHWALIFAIVERAVHDISRNCPMVDQRSAARYLAGDMFPSAAAGIDPVWLHEQIAKIGNGPKDLIKELGRAKAEKITLAAAE